MTYYVISVMLDRSEETHYECSDEVEANREADAVGELFPDRTVIVRGVRD